MADSRQSSFLGERQVCDRTREMICIDTHRILDSCKDRDCFENVRVFLTDYGQEIVEKTCAVRAKSAKILWAYIDVDPVPFNRGFYQLSIKIYSKITVEACVSPGNTQTFDGLAVVEKRLILFGSEGNVNIFKSESGCSAFCPNPRKCNCKKSSNVPVAVLETVEPIVLSSNVVRPECSCYSCTCPDDLPDHVCDFFDGRLVDSPNDTKLLVTLGFFTVVRLERPAQYLVSATEYSVPSKECACDETKDPCSVFRSMSFPISEFCTPPISVFAEEDRNPSHRCGCDG